MNQPVPVLVIPEAFDVYRIPKRPYDHDAGDRAFHDKARAEEYAKGRAADTGVQQLVRSDPRLFPHNRVLWMVQAFEA